MMPVQTARQIVTFVIDDEAIIADTLAAILRLSGYAAIPFTNPLDALSLAEAQKTVPDLIITDVVMPQMSGIDLAIRIRELCPECAVLLFSGQAATANLLLAAKAKGHNFDILEKPIHPQELLSKLTSLDITASSLFQ